MMKMNSINYFYVFPGCHTPHRAALGFAGLLRTLANLSATRLSLGTIPRPSFAAARRTVASASTVSAWHCGTDTPRSVKNAPVDNFRNTINLSIAEKTGIVDKVHKCLSLFNNPLFRTKVILLCSLYDGCYVNKIVLF
jgi:hypothetical protein